MIAIRVVSFLLGVVTVILNFRAELIIAKLFKKEADEKSVMRVKYTALILAVIAFLAVFLADK